MRTAWELGNPETHPDLAPLRLRQWAHTLCFRGHFSSKVGTALDAHSVQHSFRSVLNRSGLNAKEWTPREMRHSFVSLLSDSGVPLENISRLVGHRNTTVTEIIYRKQLRPVMLEGAEAMDRIFPNS
ncbi:tyrosine-type recombinase/integrase [Streptosporangium sp. NPDC051022]|uniref:tyrosine-type recombinase/integrase n=1 Tax=Streptosporangium sp. NPDC051022 TaxID=3155752 RepID=UPI0034408EEA